MSDVAGTQFTLLDPAPRRAALAFTLNDIRHLKNETHALRFSMRVSGFEPKEIPLLFNIEAGQWSNILGGKKYFPHDRRNEWMDFVGNEVLLMYACETRGYDFSTLRKHQSEVEQKLEAATQRIAELEKKGEIQEELFRRLVAR